MTVNLKIGPRQKLYELSDVSIQFLCPAGFRFRPAFLDDRGSLISLRVWGPAGGEVPGVTAFIDLTGRKFEAGLYADEPVRLQLPHDVQLAQSPPRSAVFQLTPTSDSLSSIRKSVPGP